VRPNNDSREEQLSDPAVALSDWPERPLGVTGDAAKELGRMLLDDAVPASAIVGALRRGAPSLGASGSVSPTLRFRVPRERVVELDALSVKLRRNQSDLLREALELLLEKHSEPASDSAQSANSDAQVPNDPLRLRPEEARLLIQLSERIAPTTSHPLAS
jgi:Arc/MetJ-type ribon-helix-helix transcriptional regulator